MENVSSEGTYITGLTKSRVTSLFLIQIMDALSSCACLREYTRYLSGYSLIRLFFSKIVNVPRRRIRNASALASYFLIGAASDSEMLENINCLLADTRLPLSTSFSFCLGVFFLALTLALELALALELELALALDLALALQVALDLALELD